MMNLMAYAASQYNPPKGYGEIGLDVALYRGARQRYYRNLGMDYVTAATKAHEDVIRKYGEAK